MTHRFKITLAYDGTHYSGYQTQPNAKTVQDTVERALTKLAKGTFVRIHAASRTDAGVHAKGQVAHFDFPFAISTDGLFKGLNTLLPDDILVRSVEEVSSDFHSRYDAKGKKYVYRLSNSQLRDPFNRLYTVHHPYPLNAEDAQEAMAYLTGQHDFSSFSASNTDVVDKVRTIYQASLDIDEDDWTFTFVGDGFLYNMIRIMVGTIIAVAEGKIDPQDILTIIEAKDREKAGKTMPAHGLCLVELYYEDLAQYFEKMPKIANKNQEKH